MNGMYIGAGLAIGLAGFGVAIGEGLVAKKSMNLMGRNPSMITFFLTITILGIALVESSAIYGLIVAMGIIGKETLEPMKAIGAGLAIGIAGCGVAIGEGLLVCDALESINRNPEIKTKIMSFMVLFVALVESAAIYGLIIAMSLIS